MKHTWRWFGLNDSVSLQDIRQSGATGIVSALHHIETGKVWSIDEIQAHKTQIESHKLQWSVVESVPVHEDIKRRQGDYLMFIENFKQTLRNLAACDIKLVCYNFMPILDWTRTDLSFELDNGAKALKFDATAFAAFDLYCLQRTGAEDEYTSQQKDDAKTYFNQLNEDEKTTLVNNIIAGLPGSTDGYSIEQFRQMLDSYQGIDKDKLRVNMAFFLKEIIPVAEENGLRMAVHPDDPPRPILGLPRIVSNQDDIDWLFNEVPSKNNGITFCTGSFGANPSNDLAAMLKSCADRIYFAHLRSTKSLNDGSFYEDDHLAGDADLVNIIRLLLEEEAKRAKQSDANNTVFEIPIRPDHGHQMLDDLNKTGQPGYSAIGRLKGLAEIRGVEMALKRYVIKQ